MQTKLRQLRNVMYELLLSDNGGDNGDGDNIKLTQNMNTAITSHKFKKMLDDKDAKIIQIQNQTVSKTVNKLAVSALKLVDELSEEERTVKVESLVRDAILLDISYPDLIEFVSRSYLRELMKMNRESQTSLAERAGMDRRQFKVLLDKYHLVRSNEVKEIECHEGEVVS